MLAHKLKKIISNTLDRLAQTGGVEKPATLPEFSVEITDEQHGDYATNAAMVLAKALKRSPRQIAQSLLDNLVDPEGFITHAEIAGPGFINFKISSVLLAEVLHEVNKEGAHYGCINRYQGKRALVEFISANPTGPLHLGHARGAFTGDAIARLLAAIGYDVEREFYVNDQGKQVLTLGRTIYARYRELLGHSVEIPKDGYPGTYVIDLAQTMFERDGNKWENADESDWLPEFVSFGIAENLRIMKKDLAEVGIAVDRWYSENSLYTSGATERLLDCYRQKNMLYDSHQARNTEDKVRREESKAAIHAEKQIGGTFLKTSDFGDEEDRILLRADGTPVYLVADLAYHQDKFERAYDRMINVFGADHAGHVDRIKAGMRALNIDDAPLEFVLVQIMRLLKDGKEVRFSKRSGDVYLLRDLISEVGPDVSRFVFLMRAATTQFDFNLDNALEQSSENPVFYVQYGHARMANLLKKARDANFTFSTTPNYRAFAELLQLPEERALLKKIGGFQDVMLGAGEKLEPHRILYFAREIVGEFHGYFTRYKQTEKIISGNHELSEARLTMVSAVKQTLHNALAILGISAPEYM